VSGPEYAQAGEGENQHFVNQGYLRGFSIPGKKNLVWEYDKVTGTVSDREKSVRRICSRPDYYSQQGADGQPDTTTIERYFAEKIEGPVAEIIRGLKPDDQNRIGLEGWDKGALAFFIGTLLARGPAFRDGVHELHRQVVLRMMKQLLESGKTDPMPPELESIYREKGFDNTFDAAIDSCVSIKPMIELGSRVAYELSGKAWTYRRPAAGMNFVTSDNPVSFRGPRTPTGRMHVGPAHPLAEISIPLRKDLMLVCRPIQVHSETELRAACGDLTVLTAQETDAANSRTIASAVRYVYAGENSSGIERQVVALRGISQRFVGR
jgi:hypothetical protein